MADPGDRAFVPAQPRDGSDGPGYEQKPVGIAQLERREMPRQDRGYREAGQVIVAERRMAGVGRDQDLVGGVSRKAALGITQVAICQRRIDADFVFTVRQAQQLADPLGPGERPGPPTLRPSSSG